MELRAREVPVNRLSFPKGKRSDREQFQTMFVAASRREFDVMAFWSLNRLSREGTVETLNHLQKVYGEPYVGLSEVTAVPEMYGPPRDCKGKVKGE